MGLEMAMELSSQFGQLLPYAHATEQSYDRLVHFETCHTTYASNSARADSHGSC